MFNLDTLAGIGLGKRNYNDEESMINNDKILRSFYLDNYFMPNNFESEYNQFNKRHVFFKCFFNVA